MDFNTLLKFLNNLKKNNNKEWFDKNRKTYDLLRLQWIDFTKLCINEIGKTDKDILYLEPKQCIFRINKDVRFSKDKSPYKTNFGINLNPGGKKSEFMGYYFHVEPNNIFMAGGSYMPTPITLAAIRQEIDYNAKKFGSIINNKTLKTYFKNLDGDKLTRPPKGYEPNNPMIEYLKHKSFIGTRNFTADEIAKPTLLKEIGKTARALKPLIDFIRESAD